MTPHNERIAIVTGGAGWIGQTIARGLVEDGMTVVVADIDRTRAQEVADGLTAAGGRAMAVELDVTSFASAQRMVAEVIGAFGAIDALINNAGGSARKQCSLFGDADPAVIDRIIDMNLKGPLFCSRAVIGHMIERKRGTIVNLGSTTGIQGLEYVVDYSAAKGGVITFTKALAKEVGKHGIRVNCVSPGLVPRPDEDPARGLRTNYLGRVCTAEDIAGPVRFFLSDQAGFITGHNLVIDGGRSLGMKEN
jgi:NAD(P)-dependent dehydrogenase (short-subunit alcohol dehydrogenase family)